ncbi:MAG: D-alanyl-D-alanine carboxypeptidase, partial [Desulfobulbaceae bacterium]|nr:D-alanyl-D-alanine carboxypeptidase [Desulfobulbaceae bacterium]
MNYYPATRIFHLLCLLLVLLPGPACGADAAAARIIDRLLSNGALLLERNGEVICSRNPDQVLAPASTWKLATALYALHTLGPDHRFTTNLYLDHNHTLYVQGGGDPFLVSEEIDHLMASLAAAGVNEINDIVLAEDLFRLTGDADGAASSSNPYDAANGALAVNFNTVNVLVKKDRRVSSAEPQTPTLPLMLELAAKLAPGEHRLNIGSDRSRIIRHAGELFRAMQIRHRIAGKGTIRAGSIPQGVP